MANHSYVQAKHKISVEEAERLLRKTVNAVLGPRLVIEEAGFGQSMRAWHIFIPGTELREEDAMSFNKAPDDPFGFSAWFHPVKALWEFRHPPNNWEWWAQNKVQQEIAQALGLKTYQDDSVQSVDPAALKSTYRQYITRNYKEPYTAEQREWLDRLMTQVPEGFRD